MERTENKCYLHLRSQLNERVIMAPVTAMRDGSMAVAGIVGALLGSPSNVFDPLPKSISVPALDIR
jgi:hypothetical protein